jgi:hypothetical protein
MKSSLSEASFVQGTPGLESRFTDVWHKNSIRSANTASFKPEL